MAYFAEIEFTSTEFNVFTGGAIGTPLTEKQGALLSSAFSFLLNRSAWESMSDSAWDALEDELAELMELVTP